MAPSSSLDRFEQHLDRVAGLREAGGSDAFFFPFVDLDDAFGLVADVDDHIFAANLENLAFDDLVRLKNRGIFADPIGNFLVEIFLEVQVRLEVVNVDGMNEVAIGH